MSCINVTPTSDFTSLTTLHGALIDAPLIPAGFWSFLRIPVPFQWNLPAKISKYWYSGTYTRTVGMDQNGMALECMTRMDLKIAKYGKFCIFTWKIVIKSKKKNRDGAHYWWWCWAHWLHGLCAFLNIVINANIARKLGKIGETE